MTTLRIRDAVPAGNVPRAKHQKAPADPLTPRQAQAGIERLRQQHPGQVENLVKFWMWTWLRRRRGLQDPRYGTPWVDKRAFRRGYWTPALKGDCARQHSIRIKDQIRLCLRWPAHGPAAVAIVDYH